MSALQVLIIGAGAVGQVYGRHLARGGAHVAYYVRERHAEACRRGFTFYRLRLFGRRNVPEHDAIAAADVITSLDQIRARTWDQVYVCLSSAQIRDAALGEVVAATGGATIVGLQPGAADREALLRWVPAERLVTGMITLISFQAPLAAEPLPAPGMAYWFPPLSRAPHSGPRAGAVVAALKAGKLPAKVVADVPRQVAYASALFMPLLTALEAAGWSFRELRKGPLLSAVRLAAREAFAASGGRPGLGIRLASRPFVLRTALWLAPRFVPFDFETYFRVHFIKVRDQTRLLMQTLIDDGRKAGIATPGLERLERLVLARLETSPS